VLTDPRFGWAVVRSLAFAGGSTVAYPDVKEAIRSERESSPVVIGVRLVDAQEHLLAGGLDLIGRGVGLKT